MVPDKPPIDHEALSKYLDLRWQEIEASGREDYFKLRKEWSTFLKRLLGVLVAFQIILTILIGMGWLDFLNYKWFIGMVVVETFLQIAGMCFVVIWFLFPKK